MALAVLACAFGAYAYSMTPLTRTPSAATTYRTNRAVMVDTDLRSFLMTRALQPCPAATMPEVLALLCLLSHLRP